MNPLDKNYSSTLFRNDNILEQKWSQKRVLYTEANPYKDPGIDFTDDPGMTDPSGAADCDINNIVATYHKTGILPGIDSEHLFADVSDAPSYQDAMGIVVQAQNQFMALDAKTRKYFDNDISTFLDFVDNPANGPELVRLGLATIRPATPSPAVPEPVAPKARSSNKTPDSSSDEK